jgi:hypothetical protein
LLQQFHTLLQLLREFTFEHILLSQVKEIVKANGKLDPEDGGGMFLLNVG